MLSSTHANGKNLPTEALVAQAIPTLESRSDVSSTSVEPVLPDPQRGTHGTSLMART
jgi:hypothetical protein